MARKIYVMVVDDQAIVREGVKALLESHEDIEVVAEAGSSDECLKVVGEVMPEIILMDMKMPGIGGIETIRLVKERYPQIRLISLTNYDDEEYVLESIKAGADAYILKDVKKGDLPKIIRDVYGDRSFIDATVTRKLFASIREPNKKEDMPLNRSLLSERELQILAYIVNGKSNKEIASAVNLSGDTIKSHLKNIYQKLNVHSRSQAASMAIREKLVHFS